MTDTIVIESLSVHFGGVVAVDEVSLSVRAQGVFGIVGPNGSGKTSLLNAVTGVVAASGRVCLDGVDMPLGDPLRSRRAGILRMFQAPQSFDDLSCLENALLGADDVSLGLGLAWFARPVMWRRERERWALATSALEQVGLSDKADRPAAVLTYGEKRLLELARVLTAQPRVVLLDEPSAGLNDEETAGLARLCLAMRDDGKTLVVIDHKINFIDDICDRIGVLEMGRMIATGEPSEVWANRRVVEAYLGGPRA